MHHLATYRNDVDRNKTVLDSGAIVICEPPSLSKTNKLQPINQQTNKSPQNSNNKNHTNTLSWEV